MIIKLDELDWNTARFESDPEDGTIFIVDKVDPEWKCFIHMDSMDGICFQTDDDDVPEYCTVYDIEVAEEDRERLRNIYSLSGAE